MLRSADSSYVDAFILFTLNNYLITEGSEITAASWKWYSMTDTAVSNSTCPHCLIITGSSGGQTGDAHNIRPKKAAGGCCEASG